MYRKNKIGLVVPAYNEQRLIKPTLKSAPMLVDRIYVVNDGSTDRTASVVKKIKQRDRRIVLINHKKNMGLGQAIITGYRKAYEDKMDITVVVGGDYQMDLKEVKKFLDPIINGTVDFTKGNRFLYTEKMRKRMPFTRLLGNTMLSFITKMATGYWKIFDSNDGYTAISREALGKVNWKKAWKWYGYNGDWMARFNVANIRIKDIPRRPIYLEGERQSQIRIGKYIFRVAPHLTRMFFWRLKKKYLIKDFHPLVLFYMLSFVLVLLGLIVAINIIVAKLAGDSISGNLAILCALLLIIGFQSFGFAILFDLQINEKLQP
ncbi:glycosyltransferase family 2 protein [Candidatus Woesearchaeota archaeon]|nr:glycosyltransferase family 2 protein [Candidatus Woesearchaeota archaeon]